VWAALYLALRAWALEWVDLLALAGAERRVLRRLCARAALTWAALYRARALEWVDLLALAGAGQRALVLR
jgi:hypothetical protein